MVTQTDSIAESLKRIADMAEASSQSGYDEVGIVAISALLTFIFSLLILWLSLRKQGKMHKSSLRHQAAMFSRQQADQIELFIEQNDRDDERHRLQLASQELSVLLDQLNASYYAYVEALAMFEQIKAVETGGEEETKDHDDLKRTVARYGGGYMKGTAKLSMSASLLTAFVDDSDFTAMLELAALWQKSLYGPTRNFGSINLDGMRANQLTIYQFIATNLSTILFKKSSSDQLEAVRINIKNMKNKLAEYISIIEPNAFQQPDVIPLSDYKKT